MEETETKNGEENKEENKIEHHNSRSIPIELHSRISPQMKSEKEELLDTFAAKYVGRGIWNMFMTMVFILKTKRPKEYSALTCILLIHYNFLHYCREIYCIICRLHAAKFVSEHKITPILQELEETIEDEEEKNYAVLYEYFKWMFEFRNSANSFANKQAPEFGDVIRYFSGEESSINPEDFSYDKIHTGIWHCYFILIVKCYQKDHVTSVYFLISNYLKYIPEKQKQLYFEFRARNDFTECIEDEEISTEELCILLFDWTYALYSYINSNSDIKVFSKEVVSEVYYNITYCSKDCGK